MIDSRRPYIYESLFFFEKKEMRDEIGARWKACLFRQGSIGAHRYSSGQGFAVYFLEIFTCEILMKGALKLPWLNCSVETASMWLKRSMILALSMVSLMG